MSFKTALHSGPNGRRVVARFWLSMCSAALGFAACSSPQTEVIARFADDAGPEAGIPDTADASQAGAAGATHVISPQRQRVKVVAGNLVTDEGTPLRGLLLPVDTGWSLDSYDFDLVTSIAQNAGLNTLHVYLEDSGQVTGLMESEADALVSLTSHAGMYLILGVGTGQNVGAFDATKLTEFWTLYAARYAAQPHVLFEIQNNPENTPCDAFVQAKTLDMERTMYKLIRSVAPDSHVLLLSTTSLLKPSVLNDAITNLSRAVDWSNAAIDMDITDLAAPCQPLANLAEVTDVANMRQVPLLIGQLPPTNWAAYLTAFEQAKIGWMQYTYFANPASRTLASYLGAVNAAGVAWCPDQGVFPQNSSTCR